jgi:hypothetical protein
MSAILDSPNTGHGSGAIPSTPIWRFSLDQCHAMIDCGILPSGDPVEFSGGSSGPQNDSKSSSPNRAGPSSRPAAIDDHWRLAH